MKSFLKNKHCTVTINHKGAELISFTKNGIDCIWSVDEKFWNKTSPILFPIVGRLKNDTYLLNDKKYTLNRHGFARDYVFSVKEKLENSITFSLQQNEETLKRYPFNFELQLKYTLENSTLTLQYFVINNSNEKMPFSIGAHPAFSITNNFEDYALQFDSHDTFETHHLENDLFNGKTSIIPSNGNLIPLNYGLFEKDALVFKNLESKTVTLIKNNKAVLSINFREFTFLGIWTKKNAPFICIEPWVGHADESTATGNIVEKKNITILNAKESFNCKFSIELF